MLRKKRRIIIFLSLLLGICFYLVNEINIVASEYFIKTPLIPLRYKKNAHSSQKITIKNNRYIYRYKFKDHKNNMQIWSWSYDKDTTDRMIDLYGVPPSIFQPYSLTKKVIERRGRQIKNGMFKKDGNFVGPDENAIINNYMKTVYPVYRLLEKACKEENFNKRDRIELLMKFCQDIPYGVPPYKYRDKVICGLFPPPLFLVKGWGDCDTKAVLFASILSYDPNYKIVFVETPGHVLLGIEGIPKPYDKYITYSGKKYIYCEPVGPGRSALGKVRTSYRSVNKIEPIIVNRKAIQSAVKGVPTDIYIEQLGHSFKMLLVENNKVINNKGFKLFVNTKGFSSSFTGLQNMPDENGVYTYGTDKKKIYVWLKKPGYHIFISAEILKGKRKREITFDFSKGKCMYIKTKPNANVNIYKKSKGGRYSGSRYKADKKGIIRIICEPQEYDISSTTRLSRKLIKFDYFNGIYAYVER